MVKEGDIITGTYLFDDYRMRHVIIMEHVNPAIMENKHAELVSLKRVYQGGEAIQARMIKIEKDGTMYAEEV